MTTDTMVPPNALIQQYYQHHYAWLYQWLSRKIGSSFDAADLVQDTFLRVLLKPELDALHEPRAYLTTIAHGLMVNHLRRREVERAYLEAVSYLPEYQTQSPEVRAIALEMLMRIDAMLSGLPHKVRQALLLSQLEGMTHAQIAKELAVSVASVRLYIAKAIGHCIAIELAD